MCALPAPPSYTPVLPLSRHSLQRQASTHEPSEAHGLRQCIATNAGSAFAIHDDTQQGDETVVVKCTEDVAGIPQSPILFHPI